MHFHGCVVKNVGQDIKVTNVRGRIQGQVFPEASEKKSFVIDKNYRWGIPCFAGLESPIVYDL